MYLKKGFFCNYRRRPITYEHYRRDIRRVRDKGTRAPTRDDQERFGGGCRAMPPSPYSRITFEITTR